MKIDELGMRMRIFESAGDDGVLPKVWIVARLDGRNFTRLTREVLQLTEAYDLKFRDAMVATVTHLMDCGFNLIYGYSQSDEISLLFHRDDNTFNRRVRKIISVLAGEASAKFSAAMATHACFDCRISQLITNDHVVEYFRWRQEDAHRNAISAHCYWQLRNSGVNARDVTQQLLGMSNAAKNELLFQHGINFNDLPTWQKRGFGVGWQQVVVEGMNPITNQAIEATRRRLTPDFNLPMRDDYVRYILCLLDGDNSALEQA